MSEPAPGRLSDDALTALVERSDRRGLAHLALHVLTIAAAGAIYASAFDTAWMLPAAWLYGTTLVFLFAPLHETVHYTAFRSRWLNRAVSSVCGWILVLPPRYFRAFHLEHHRYTQDPERDPELAVAPPATRYDYLWRVSGLQYWTSRIRTTLMTAAGRVTEAYITPSERTAVVREARLYLASYVALAAVSTATGSTAVLWLWLVPVVLGQPMLRLYLLAEHTGCPMVPDMLANSRTVHTNAIVRFLAWNMPYHAEHHAYAAIPFHALPRAHAALGPFVRVQSQGYARVHRELMRDLR
ncbi:MAG: fatty acid desaturase [Thiotrichales bacterium]|nr:fatty acid desaturase [Thiotrichales bacterium]